MGNSHGHRKHRNGPTSNHNPSPNYYGPPPYLHAPPPGPSSSQIGNEAASRMSSLPYGHVDSSLRSLAGQAEGFGRFAVGGLHGPLYHVTTLAGTGFLCVVGWGVFGVGVFSLSLLFSFLASIRFFSFYGEWKRIVLKMLVAVS